MEDAEELLVQLRFYVKHAGPRLLQRSGPLTVRLTLKELAWPRRRIVVPVKSNVIAWRPPAGDDFADEDAESRSDGFGDSCDLCGWEGLAVS